MLSAQGALPLSTGDAPAEPAREAPASVKPLSETTYKVTFTASESCHEKLREAQDLLRHRIQRR